MQTSNQRVPGQEIIATCTACWLATREIQKQLEQDKELLAETSMALGEAVLNLKE